MAPSTPKTIAFITTNKNKIREITTILSGMNTNIPVEFRALDLPEIQGTTEEIALDKCRRAAVAINGPVLIEDSSLEFHALGGLPGPYIKYFYSALGNDGLNTLLAGFSDKAATAVCTIAFSSGPESEPVLFQGRNLGRIVEKRGGGGFAYDPIFEFEGRTYAEMDPDEKNRTSDRYKTLLQFEQWLVDDSKQNGTT